MLEFLIWKLYNKIKKNTASKVLFVIAYYMILLTIVIFIGHKLNSAIGFILIIAIITISSIIICRIVFPDSLK